MRAREVVEVAGGEPPVEGGRGDVVAPLEGGQTGLDCAREQRLRNQPPRCPGDRGAVGVRNTPYDRALSAPRSRRQARDEGPMTHFRAAARHPPTDFRWRPIS